MPIAKRQFREAIEDFRRARQRAALEELNARLTGKSTALLSFDDVARKLRAQTGIERGVQDIPLAAIVGSVGRCNDFTRSFLPRKESDGERWAGVKAVATSPDSPGWPPIEVYQIGTAYFVKDGHHRVSVAREMGSEVIQAYVTEVATSVPLSPDVQPDELIVKAEYAEFLEFTQIARLCPGADLSVSVPGQYERIAEHIEVQHYFMENERGQEVAFDDAVVRWYDDVYLPVALAIRERGILRDFPERTEADLYLWVVENRLALQREMGWKVSDGTLVRQLPGRSIEPPQHWVKRAGKRLLQAVLPVEFDGGPATGQWRKDRTLSRYADRLFADVLLALGPDPAHWHSFEHAVALVQREGAGLCGMHVVPDESAKGSYVTMTLQEEYAARCAQAGIPGNCLGLESGDLVRKICERALLADLVVLGLGHTDSPTRTAPGTLRSVLKNCARPVLAVAPGAPPIGRALLAFDGNPRAREALFVAAYMAERWGLPLTVLAVLDPGHVDEHVLDQARAYLEMHEVAADYLLERGNAPQAILRTAEERGCELTLIGSYSVSTVAELFIGTAVDHVLRATRGSVLVCR